MIRHLVFVIVFLAVFSARTEAAPPPPGGALTLEQRVTRGCQYAELVIVAKVVKLRAQPQEGGERQTGDLQLIELIKGTVSEVPKTISDFKSVPRPTDSLKDDLEDQATYLFFMNAPAAPGLEDLIRGLRYDAQTSTFTDDVFHALVSLARSACR